MQIQEQIEDCSGRKELLEQAFYGIMILSEKDRKQVLSEFAERHGWYIE